MICSGTIDSNSGLPARQDLVALVVGTRHAPWRLSLCEALKRQGYRVMVASNCERALSRFERHRAPIQLVAVGGEDVGWSVRQLGLRISRISPSTRVVAV